MNENERLLVERIKSLERRLAAMERREFTVGGSTGDMLKSTYDTNSDGIVGNADQLDGNHASAFAVAAKGVTNGDSHDHNGGDGAQIDHGGLGGLSDNDHDLYNAYSCQGRLTLESGVAVSTSNQSAKTTLYFTPYRGDKIALYDGSVWKLYSFTERSISLSGKTVSTPYDVFIYDNSGTLTLELLAWTNTTTRATALATQNGILVKSGAATRRYLGTIYINSSGGQTDDTVIARYIWNYYNRINRRLYVLNTTTHTYNGALRKWNNSDTNNLLGFVIGWAENDNVFSHTCQLKAGADGNYAYTTFYANGSQLDSAYSASVENSNVQAIQSGVTVLPALSIGYNYIQLYEGSNHNDSSFVAMAMYGMISG
jgi:hypothetical protein